MKNIEKYQNLISKGEVDALLLTSKHNRQYAAEYCIAEGVAVICKTQSYYFTDFRYIESAQKNLPGFAVKMVDTEHPYTKLINEAISDNTVKTIGFEDDTLTVEEYTLYNTKLNAVLHPYAAEINAPRASKEPWEIEYMKKAQEITDRTFDDLLNVIHPGMTEKELCAELIYRLYKYGSEGPSFDPITVSGPNTSLPHGVPSERVLQYGDFVTMDFGCLYHGYCSDMTRTIALGYVSEKMDKVYHTVLEAQLAGIAATKADVLYTYGTNSVRMVSGAITGGMKQKFVDHFDTHEELAHMLKMRAKPGDVILFKGSRGMRMEKALSLFLKEEES